jgi:hypothetical protein
MANASASCSWANLRRDARLTLPDALNIFAIRPIWGALSEWFDDTPAAVSLFFCFLKRANFFPSIFALLYNDSNRSAVSNSCNKTPDWKTAFWQRVLRKVLGLDAKRNIANQEN